MLFDRLNSLPPSVAEVIGVVTPGFFQEAYVVADIEAAQDAFTSALGVSKFMRLPASDLPYRYRGRKVECALELAFGLAGGIQIELMQPVRGEGVHVDKLAELGSHPNHLGFLVTDLDSTLTDATEAGLDPIMSGEFGSLRFAYLDTWDTLGLYLEVMEDPDDMLSGLTP